MNNILPSPPKLNLLQYPVLDRQTADNGVRHYVDPTGKALPSVTTILSATADNAGLAAWKEWVGEKQANKVVTEAVNIGSLMHENLECYLEDRERPRGNNLIRQLSRRMANTIIENALVKVDEVWGIEAPLYYPDMFAGTTDIVGVFEGEPAIMDFKSAKKIKKEDQIEDYYAQLGAYGLAHDILFGTKIRKGVIFMASRDLHYKCFEISGDEFEKHQIKFLTRLERYMESA